MAHERRAESAWYVLAAAVPIVYGLLLGAATGFRLLPELAFSCLMYRFFGALCSFEHNNKLNEMERDLDIIEAVLRERFYRKEI